AAHGRVDGGTGEEVLRRAGLHRAGSRVPGVATRGVQPDVPVLHARQTPDPETARGLQEGEGARLFAAEVPRRVRAPRWTAGEADPQNHAARRHRPDAGDGCELKCVIRIM